jgi:histidinol-phosphate aminotransferase
LEFSYWRTLKRSGQQYEEKYMNDLTNGVSRRNFMRILGAASAAATSFPALAAVSPQTARRGMGGDDMGSTPRNADTVIISSNENPLGPAQSALTALCSTAALGGRYHQEESQKTIAVFTDLFALPKVKAGQGYAALFPGSGGPLDLALMSNIGPDKPLVYGDPS